MTAQTAYLEQVSQHIARDALPHLNLADYRFSGMCDDRHLPEDLAQLFASLPELPKKLGRSAQAVFIELHQNISRYGYRHRPDKPPAGVIEAYIDPTPHHTTLTLVASNLISSEQMARFQPVLDEFYIYKNTHLDSRYRVQLTSPEHHNGDKSSAGLGLLEMAKRSQGQMDIQLTQHQDHPAIVSVICTIKEVQVTDRFHLSATNRSPEIRFEPEQGLLVIAGECYPENITSFFHDIETLLAAYLKDRPAQLQARIALSYFNSGSARALLELALTLDKAAAAGTDIQLEWHCDAEDDISQEFATDIAGQTSSLNFEIIPHTDGLGGER